MLEKLNQLKNWQAAIIITIVGLAVFWTGLNSPFMGDDLTQIVNNPVVHSASNVPKLFTGSTSYSNQTDLHLEGSYYRPTMMSSYAVIYSVFGAKSLAFHIFQLVLYMLCAIFLYLFLRFSFGTLLSLTLALVFLLHPINSQTVYSISALQETLFFLFGIAALWALIKFNSLKSLLAVALLLGLSILSKETGVLFILMALIYLFWWDRKRFYPFLIISSAVVAAYLLLRINATGLNNAPHNGPIDNAGLVERLFTIPSIIGFYLLKFVFPFKLATVYHWVHPSYSAKNFLLPLMIEIFLVSFVIYVGVVIRRKLDRSQFFTYVFFAIWLVIGLLAHSQIIPLDMTVCENWFIFPIVGLLGLLGVTAQAYREYINYKWMLIAPIIVLALLGLRTSIRGLDYKTEYKLSKTNVSVSRGDYYSNTYIARQLIEQGKFVEARPYAEKSVSIYPTNPTYNDLGLILTGAGDYVGAKNAYTQALQYKGTDLRYSLPVYTYQQMAGLMLAYPDRSFARDYFAQTLQVLPEDCVIWQDLALFEQQGGHNDVAKQAMNKAAGICKVDTGLYKSIMNNSSFYLQLGKSKQVVKI